MILTNPDPFITAAELKEHLNKSSSTPDAEFETFVNASCEMIRDRMGQISPVDATETFRYRYTDVLVLSHTPVLSITTATDDTTGLEIPVDDWALESKEGIVRHSLRWANPTTFLYQAGLNPIPDNYILAALDLGAHLWKASQQNSQGGRPSVGSDGQIIPGSSWALPYSVRQTLGLDKRPRRDVWIG